MWRWLWLMAALGGLWGACAYAILWGYTSIQVTRPFVNSLPGLASLLPARIIIYGIEAAEHYVAGHPFDLSRNHEWIGAAATGVGAVLVVTAFLLGRMLTRRFRHPAPA